MSEILNNHENATAEQEEKWQQLREDVPFAGDQDSSEQAIDVENHEELQQQYETELLSPADVKSDLENFVIQDGKVYDKQSNDEILDTDTILRVKTSKFLFNEALNERNIQKQMLGKRFKDSSSDYYIDKMMQKYSIRDEENTFGPNKLIRALLTNNKFNGPEGSPTAEGTKFSMFAGPKAEYGKALLERKFRQRGLTMTDFNMTIDTSTQQHDGYSTFNININTKPIADDQEDDGSLHHPAAEQLQELDAKLIEAKQNGDQKEAHKILMQLRRIVAEKPLIITREDFQKMSDDEKHRYYMLKYKEAQVLGAKKMEDYWKQQALDLQKSKNSQS